METKSSKAEILNGLKELKEKGVNIIIHDSFIERNFNQGFTINSGSFVTVGTNIHHNENNDVTIQIKTLKKASDLTVHIYQNSTEDEIKNQITSIVNHLDRIEKESKSSAIVDYLKESGLN